MAFPKIDGYVVTEKLGSGSYSTVYKAYTKVGGRQTVAIKCVDKARMRGSAADNLISEIRLLKELRHPHIVHMQHFTWDQRNIYIIMEYCCGGDLSKYIRRYGRVPEKQVLYFLQQLASALKFLREKDVVHMDLKPHNLLLQRADDGKRILKLADFGFASVVVGNGASLRGSPLYMAPEMLAGKYDARVDLWSVGVIMYECLFGSAPYSSATLQQLIEKLATHKPIEIPRNSSISSGCRDLLTRLLKHDPDQRISYEDFFKHPYLDLEHMPNRENYEKAVSLIKQAIELDSKGDLRSSLECYLEGLRFLVPFVGAESDALRRGALTAKLNRYMERAEEIKQYLRDPTGASLHRGNDVTSVTSATNVTDATNGMRQVGCCGRGGGNAHRELTQYRASKASEGVEETAAPIQDPASDHHPLESTEPTVGSRPTEEANSSNKPTTTRFKFSKLFGRSPLPYLETKDSTIAAGVANDAAKSESDACRIT